jgi:hypothetical protein
MCIRRFSGARSRRKLIAIAIALGIAQSPVQVLACGGTAPVAQIQTGASLYIFPGFGQLGVTGTAGTATTANSWRIGWYGGAGVTHFSGRMIDSGGGAIYSAGISNGTTTQPSPDELDFAATFDLSTASGVQYIDFSSTSRTIEVHLDADAFYIVSYPAPGNVERHPNTDPFALSFDAAPTAVPDAMGNVFCSGFE